MASEADKKAMDTAVAALKKAGIFEAEAKHAPVPGMKVDMGITGDEAQKLHPVGKEHITGALVARDAKNSMHLHVELATDGVKRAIEATVDMGGKVDYNSIAPADTLTRFSTLIDNAHSQGHRQTQGPAK